MKIPLPVLVLLLISLTSCAQTKYGVIKKHAYYYEFVPGAIAVDDNGVQVRQIDTVYAVFLETRGSNKPTWKRAWVNGNTYRVLTTIMATPYTVGLKNDSDDTVKLSAKKGNQLLQLNLEKIGTSPAPAAYRDSLTRNNILFEGDLTNKKVYLIVNKPVHLRGKEYQ